MRLRRKQLKVQPIDIGEKPKWPADGASRDDLVQIAEERIRWSRAYAQMEADANQQAIADWESMIAERLLALIPKLRDGSEVVRAWWC